MASNFELLPDSGNQITSHSFINVVPESVLQTYLYVFVCGLKSPHHTHLLHKIPPAHFLR